LSPALCVVVGYDNRGVGDVVLVRHGSPAPGVEVPGSKWVLAISCPGAAGCVALGQPPSSVGAVVVELSSTGAITSSKVVDVPAGVDLTRIACWTTSSCVLAGVDVFASPESLEVGYWDGTSLSLHSVKAPAGTTDPTIEGAACSGSTCALVGYADKGTGNEGLVLGFTGGQPGALRTVAGGSIYGVSCVGPALCYAAGFTRTGGFVLTLDHGTAGAEVPVKGDLFGIACRAQVCVAAGEVLAPPGAPARDDYYGLLVWTSGGKVTSTQLVPASGGFTSAAQAKGAFAAEGAAQGKGSEVTTGSL